MSPGLFWLLSFGGFAAVSLLCGILVWPQLAAAWPSIEEKIDRFRRLPPFAKLVMLLFVGAFVVYGSTKTNQMEESKSEVQVEERNLPSDSAVQPERARCPFHEGEDVWNGHLARSVDLPEQESDLHSSTSTFGFDYPPPPVTPEDIARGWQLWEVRTNCNISYTMPEGAMMASNWWVRGAYEDCSIVRLGDCSIGCCANQSNNQNNPNNRTMSFPFGTNEYSSLWAFSWGKVRFALGDTNTEIVAVGAPMSAVPYRSRLWSAADTNGARVVTWENFALGRVGKEEVLFDSSGETPLPRCVNAQIELKRNGDFITRSNVVEKVYRRVDPDDYDGDGWENRDDPDPCNWDEFYEDFWQELPAGDYACNYCWIEIRPQWNSWIVFTGDGPSNLEDPCFWGKAGETYRVQLLIGKTYDVTSSQPLSVVGRSNEAIEVSESGPCSFSVVWPVTFTVGEGRYAARPLLGATLNDGGKSFYVLRDPAFLRGTNVWWGGCCSISGDGTNFNFTCNNTCACEGCTAYGYFTYSGYTLDLPDYFECGCHYVPDEGPAEVSISFDRSAVIYEDTYTNMPDEVVHPVRSNAVLRCSVSGGTYGGTLSVTLSDAAHQKLRMVRGDMLPTNERIEPGTGRSYEVVYEVLEPSDSVRDIQAAAVFHEDFLNVVHSNDTSMTSVKVELEAVYIAPTNHNQSRHIYGVGEKVKFKVTPALAEVSITTRKFDENDGGCAYELFDGCETSVDGGAEHTYTCPIAADYHPPIEISLSNVKYRPSIRIVEPEEVLTPEADWFGCHSPGDVGQSTLVTTNYIGPLTVSFRGVRVAEVPCEEVIAPMGYFATSNFVGYRTHTQNAGAGLARLIQARNRWTMDEAGGGQYPNWEPGRLEWKIPIGWFRIGPGDGEFGDVEVAERVDSNDRNSRELLIGGRTDAYKQVFTIDEDGTAKVEKFGHWLSRGRYCRIYLDGVMKKWNHWLWEEH